MKQFANYEFLTASVQFKIFAQFLQNLSKLSKYL